MTPAQIITTARYTLNDYRPDYRQSDDELLAYVNDGLRECVILRPELFSTIGDMTCVADQCEQSLTFDDAVALLEVLCLHTGAAIIPFDLNAMNAFNPNWRADAQGTATQWTKFANDPLRFYIYPKAPPDQIIDVRYVRNPVSVALNDLISDLPVTYQPALVDYVIYRSEMKDSEHVLSQRAVGHQQAFVAKIKG